MHDPIYEETRHDHQIKIYHDADPPNPREWCTFGTIVCWHRRYSFGDDHTFEDARDFLIDLVGCSGETKMPIKRLLVMAQRKAVILPLYLYDHSGLAMNTTGFHCPWDSGQVGFIYVRLEDLCKEFAVKRATAHVRSRAEERLRSEIAAYHDYISGNTYGYSVEHDGEIIDSCWGFGGDYEGYCLVEAREAVSASESVRSG